MCFIFSSLTSVTGFYIVSNVLTHTKPKIFRLNCCVDLLEVKKTLVVVKILHDFKCKSFWKNGLENNCFIGGIFYTLADIYESKYHPRGHNILSL